MTPTGNRNVAAITCIPVLYAMSVSLDLSSWEVSRTHRAEMAALAPRSMLAIAMMLLIKHNTIQTTCPRVPYRILTISRSVWASGILSLQAIPRRAKKTIIGEQLDDLISWNYFTVSGCCSLTPLQTKMALLRRSCSPRASFPASQYSKAMKK